MSKMPSIPKLLLCGLVAVALTWSSPARAGDLAEQHLKRGVRLLAQNKDKEALDEFKAAYAISPSPKAAAEMGLAECSLKLWLDAEKHLTESLQAASDDWIKRNKVFIEEQLNQTRTHLGWLVVRGTFGAEVTVDGAVVGRLPLPEPKIRRPEGPVEIKARSPERGTVVKEVQVFGGSESAVILELPQRPRAPIPSAFTPAASTPPAAPPLPRTSRAVAYRALPWVSLGAGVLALADFAVLLDSNRSSCGGSSACGPSKPLEVAVFLTGAAGFVMGGQALIFGVTGRKDPRIVKPVLLIGSAAAAVGAMLGGYALVKHDGYGSSTKLGFGTASIATGSAILLFDVLALFEPTPGRPRPAGVALAPLPNGLALVGAF
jgi:hypothetical protein